MKFIKIYEYGHRRTYRKKSSVKTARGSGFTTKTNTASGLAVFLSMKKDFIETGEIICYTVLHGNLKKRKGVQKMEKQQKIKNRKGIKYQIQSKIGVSISVVMALVILLVVLVVYNLLTDANDMELQQDAYIAAAEVEKYFAPFERMVEQQAANEEITNLLTTTGKGERLEKNSHYAAAIRQMAAVQQLDSSNVLAVWVAGLEASEVISSDGSMSGEGFDITSRDWYGCITSGKTILTEPYVDEASGQTVVSVASPVYHAGKAVGVSGMDISIDVIITLMKNYTIGDNGYIMLLNADGNFIYHPKEHYINTLISDMEITDNVVKAVKSLSTQLIKYTVSGEAKYGYTTPVGDTGLVVLSCIPSSQYYSSLISAVVMLLVVLLGGLLFIILNMGKTAGNIVKPLLELNENAMQLAEGNLNVVINAQTEDEVGDLGRSIDKTVARLKEYINYIDEISDVLAAMADGKLEIRLKYAYVGEFQKVKEALVHISDSMNDVMTNITQAADQVSSGSDELARAAQGLAEGSESQAAAAEELLATATTVAEQVEENKNDSQKSAVYTREVADMMMASKRQMAVMREAMDKIQESSKKVVGVIKTIEDIAEQTNLLSLNASIEAARAGEAGRGFAVVAGEIGSLANESAGAVTTTRELIGVSLEEIAKGNALVNEVVESLDRAVERVEVVNRMIQKTAETAEVQMHSVNQIRDGVDEMSRGVQENSALAEETSATSEELAAQAVALNELVQKFELKK